MNGFINRAAIGREVKYVLGMESMKNVSELYEHGGRECLSDREERVRQVIKSKISIIL